MEINLVEDFIYCCYCYDIESDELFMKYCPENRQDKISLGSCRDLINDEHNLWQLIEAYADAVDSTNNEQDLVNSSANAIGNVVYHDAMTSLHCLEKTIAHLYFVIELLNV